MKTNKYLTISLTVIVCAITWIIAHMPPVSAAESKTFYVDINKGTKNGNGSASSPFKTLEQAKDVIRNMKNKGDITVDIAPGDYFIDEPIVFDSQDSAEDGYKIRYTSSAEEKPVISGGKRVDGWNLADAEKNVYVADVDMSGIRQMYVNDKRAVRARTDDYSVINQETAEINSKGYVTSNPEVGNWKNVSDIEFVYVTAWKNSRCRVQEIRTENNQFIIDMNSSLWRLIHSERTDGTNVSYPYYIENAYEFLDEPGEFYYNRFEKKLYYIPRDGENMKTAEVVVPSLERLVTVSGDLKEHIRGITFDHIAFEHTALFAPDSHGGWNDVQNNILKDDADFNYMNPAVYVSYADDVNFTDCEFSKLGGMGLNFYWGVRDSNITGNQFYDIAGGALAIGAVSRAYTGDLMNDTYNINVNNNYIHDVSFDYRGGAGLTIGYVSDVNVVHNEIGNLPWVGIHGGWGWVSSPVVGKRFYNINIEKNYLYNTMRGPTRDGGAIYMLGATGGTLDNLNEISENYIRQTDATTAPGCIYTDEGSSFYHVNKNVIDTYEAHSYYNYEVLKSINIWTNTICHVYSENNYYFANAMPRNDGTKTYENSILMKDVNWTDEAKTVMKNAGLEDEYRKILGGAKTEGFEKLVLDREISLKEGESIELTYFAQNSYGEMVSSNSYEVSFESENPEIVSVNQDTVTAHSSGMAQVIAIVKYGGKERRVPITVTVGDELSDVSYKDNTQVLLLDGTIETELICKTLLGNTVTDYQVVYESSNPEVARVDSNGVIKAISPGMCDITARVTSNGKTVSAVRTIKCQAKEKFDATGIQVIDISNAFDQADAWNIIGNGTVKQTSKYTLSTSGYSGYGGEVFEDTLLNFNVKIESPDTGWPTICFRMQDAAVNPITKGNSYLVTIKPDVIELQRFNSGKRTLLYGAVDGAIGKYGIMSNETIRYGKEYSIQLGALTQTDGNVRLIMNVNGYNVFDCIDDLDGRITTPGYFGCINQDGTTVFTKFRNMSAEEGAETPEFEDISDSWAKADIKKLQSAGIVHGITSTQFMPENTITRAEFLAMVVRVLNLSSMSEQKLFDDVEMTTWYAQNITAAVEAGLIDSHLISNDNFLPDKPIRRDEMASLLVLGYEYFYGTKPDLEDLSGFMDCETVETWAKNYIMSSVSCGLLRGDDSGFLLPTNTATRAEASAVLNRFMQLIE